MPACRTGAAPARRVRPRAAVRRTRARPGARRCGRWPRASLGPPPAGGPGSRRRARRCPPAPVPGRGRRPARPRGPCGARSAAARGRPGGPRPARRRGRGLRHGAARRRLLVHRVTGRSSTRCRERRRRLDLAGLTRRSRWSDDPTRRGHHPLDRRHSPASEHRIASGRHAWVPVVGPSVVLPCALVGAGPARAHRGEAHPSGAPCDDRPATLAATSARRSCRLRPAGSGDHRDRPAGHALGATEGAQPFRASALDRHRCADRLGQPGLHLAAPGASLGAR